MAHKLTIVKVDKPAATTSNVEVPAEDAAELLDAYNTLTANPDTEGMLQFDTADERKAYIRIARVWAGTQTPALNFRQLPQAGNPETVLRFSIKVRPTDAERAQAKADAKARQDARAAAKAAEAAQAAGTVPAS